MKPFEFWKEEFDTDYQVLLIIELKRIIAENNWNLDLDQKFINNPDGFFLILLRKINTSWTIPILTSDETILTKAKQNKEEWEKTSGKILEIICTAISGLDSYIRRFSIENLVESLNIFPNWEFLQESSYSDRFRIRIRVNEDSDFNLENLLQDVENFLDFLATEKKIGLIIDEYYVIPIHTKKQPTLSVSSSSYQIIDPLNEDEIKRWKSSYTGQDLLKIQTIRSVLRNSYIENRLQSRIALLWASIEDLYFDKKSQNTLLTKPEIESLIKCTEEIPSLKRKSQKKENQRIEKLSDFLKTPQHLPDKNRNEMISEKIFNEISNELNMSINEIDKKIKSASSARGKYLHSSDINNKENLLKSIEFLELVLVTQLRKIENLKFSEF